MFAHFFKSKNGCTLIISNTVQPVGKSLSVSGKKEARVIAKQQKAKPWNF